MAFSVDTDGELIQYEISYADQSVYDPLSCEHALTINMLIFPLQDGGWACQNCIQGCSVCQTIVLRTSNCFSCCRKACSDCDDTCHSCRALHCANCLRYVGGNRLCKACRDKCDECLRWFEKGHITFSETYDGNLCSECVADFE